ncbi:MAG: hypothetical protein QNJ37_10180 [Crocosphaera sp.]|nr:hypothetical protein [Crocosphaera sp.]
MLKKVKNPLIFAIAVTTVSVNVQSAQAATFDVTSITVGNFQDLPDSTVNGITYLNQQLPIQTVTGSNGQDWRVGTGGFATDLFIRRTGVASGSNDPGASIVWSERQTGDPATTVRGSLPISTEITLQGNNIFEGTDNTFSNFANTNATDIERLDFVVSEGIEAILDRAVIVAERGSNTIHDGFQIAPITSLGNGVNDPLSWSFGSLLSINGGTWGTTNLRTASQTPPGAGSNPYTVLNDASGSFTNTASLNQNFGAVLITLDELVPQGSTIFGYSLFGFDTLADGNGNAVADWNNSTFYPTDTRSSGQDNAGGIDLVALNVGITRNNDLEPEILEREIPEPTSILSLIGITGLGFLLGRKKEIGS